MSVSTLPEALRATPAPGDEQPRLSQGFDSIVCLSPDRWGDMKRPEQLMRRLAHRAPILYVEAPVHLASVLKSSKQVGSDKRWGSLAQRQPREVLPGLWVYTPVSVVPRHRLQSWSLGPFGDALVRLQDYAWAKSIGRCARGLGMRSSMLWFAEPRTPGHFRTGPEHLVYDCVDRWLGFPGPIRYPRWRRSIESDESALLSGAGTVFCSSRGLLDAKRVVAARPPVLLRNGADVPHFNKAVAMATPGAPELDGISRPIVGYVGALAEWVDFELIHDVAVSRPDWSIVLVGPLFAGAISGTDPVAAELDELPNVHLLGARDYAVLPQYLKSFDVSIIPFKVDGLTEDTNPIKLYEYLAAGLPVVSTPLPEVASVPDVRIAADSVEFERQIEQAFQQRNDAAAQATRLRVADENSWDARAEAAWQTITRFGRPLVMAPSVTGGDDHG